MTAILTVTEIAARHHRYVLDCDHGTTTVDYLRPGVGGVSEAEILHVLRSRHRESCDCADVIQLDAEAVA